FAAEAAGESMSTVMLQLPDTAPVRRIVRWAPGQSTADMRISTPLNQKGLITATALLEPGAPGSDALEADNRRQALVRSRQQLSVLLAGRHRPDADTFTPQNLVTTALAPVADQLGWPLAIKSQDAAALETDQLQETDVLFVLRPDLLDDRGWSATRSWVSAGGLAWFFTPPSTAPSLWPQTLADTFDLTWSAKLEGISTPEAPLKLATDAAVAAELMRLRTDLPELIRPIEIYRHLPIDPESLSLDTDQLLVGVGDEPLLIGASVPSHGRVLLLATAIDPQWTNLPTKPLFVPLLHEVMRAAIDQMQPPRDYEVGDRPHLGETWSNTARLLDPSGKDLLLVQDRKSEGTDPGGEQPGPTSLSVRPIRPFGEPGVYRSETNALTVNVRADAANTAASDPKYLKSWLGAVGEWRQVDAENPATAMLEQQQMADLGWPLLWAVLGLALVETFLARSVSHADVSGRTLDASSMNQAA
ncbi:MAG: hypothetical protein OER86_01050, partial [Phycisphaerae bacterium]|nr:hypothetical protein [Phycisphaerae bacterium]